MKQTEIKVEDNTNKLSQFYEMGVVDEEGRLIQENMK